MMNLYLQRGQGNSDGSSVAFSLKKRFVTKNFNLKSKENLESREPYRNQRTSGLSEKLICQISLRQESYRKENCLISFSGTRESGSLRGLVARDDMIPSLVSRLPPVKFDRMSELTVRVVRSSVTLAGGSSESASSTACGKAVRTEDVQTTFTRI